MLVLLPGRVVDGSAEIFAQAIHGAACFARAEVYRAEPQGYW